MTSTIEYVTPVDAGIKVGDYFYASWGYDQTNITWFKVVGFTAKCVKIQQVNGTLVTDNGPYTEWVPTATVKVGGWVRDPDFGGRTYDPDVPAPVLTKRIKSYGGTAYLAWESYADLKLWDGTPKYQTGSGWGH